MYIYTQDDKKHIEKNESVSAAYYSYYVTHTSCFLMGFVIAQV